jgi:hypothetical protein
MCFCRIRETETKSETQLPRRLPPPNITDETRRAVRARWENKVRAGAQDAGEREMNLPTPSDHESGVGLGASVGASEDSLETLARFLAHAGHLRERYLAFMGLDLDEDELVRTGMLRRVIGPCRWDNDWLIANGHLLALVVRIKGSAVENAWQNYKERNN